jgi:endo-1,3-1,4-beta-glycanase ExoK
VKSHAIAGALALLLGVGGTYGSENDEKHTGGASFFESFTRLNPKRWSISHDWVNNEIQACRWWNKNVAIDSSGLTLSLKLIASLPGKYTCAEIASRETYHYGTYEVRMRAASGSGVNTGFFTYVGGEATKSGKQDEIDFEFLGKNTGQVQLNYLSGGENNHEFIVDLGFDAAKTEAWYAFEWLPDRIRWLVNGKQVHEVRAEDGKPFPLEGQKIVLDLWAGTGVDAWLGPFDGKSLPLHATYVSVAFTKAGDPCQFPESAVCSGRGAGGH